MRQTEKNYDFRKKMLTLHKADIRCHALCRNNDEFEIKNGFVIVLEKNPGDVILTAARDFQDYLYTSMNVSSRLTEQTAEGGAETITVHLAADGALLGEGNGYMGYKLTVGADRITVDAYDERGVAQAFYYLEELMTLRRAPYLKIGEEARRAMFSPRMVHSGYELDSYPDAHLAAIAHAGMDAILLFVKDVDTTPCGHVDFNGLIDRAAKYGLDVYAYSYMISEKHPDDPDAEEYYESTYGRLFAACPKLKGVILVGESVEMPSKDPHTTGRIGTPPSDGVPSGKIRPGWWPCMDYPDWLNLIKKIIRKHNSEADIVFWSYNWCDVEKEARIRLIRSLPKDISLLVTFETGQFYERDGVTERVADYTLSLEGPGPYFLSEAEAAKENGIRLYSMTNTGGLTWDFGVIPYEPFPQQWQRRHDSIIAAHEKYGLCGLMESHHFGLYPSFISQLAKWNFTVSDRESSGNLQRILSAHFGENNVEKLEEALSFWSEGIRFYIATGYDQYGPFRIGPAYPLCLIRRLVPPEASYAHFGTEILAAEYRMHDFGDARVSPPSVRLEHETASLIKMEELFTKGLAVMEAISEPNDETEELYELGLYIRCCIRTTINTKLFAKARAAMNASTDKASLSKHLDEMEQAALNEIENAEAAIPLVRKNSRLGWEPSMEYLGDEAHIDWKIRQVKYMLEHELGDYKRSLAYCKE